MEDWLNPSLRIAYFEKIDDTLFITGLKIIIAKGETMTMTILEALNQALGLNAGNEITVNTNISTVKETVLNNPNFKSFRKKIKGSTKTININELDAFMYLVTGGKKGEENIPIKSWGTTFGANASGFLLNKKQVPLLQQFAKEVNSNPTPTINDIIQNLTNKNTLDKCETECETECEKNGKCIGINLRFNRDNCVKLANDIDGGKHQMSNKGSSLMPPSEDILKTLKTSKQIILQGPPGTGKTRMAKIVAQKLLAEQSKEQSEISKDDNTDNTLLKDFKTNENIHLIQFHPSYTYEDFVIGLDVGTEKGSVSYKVKSKEIKEFSEKAANQREQPYVLIIDEINRAPLTSVFGELMYALEYRGSEISVPYGQKMTIPDNLYIIGTMNTADRSIEEIDYALRRRFAFVRIPPVMLKPEELDNQKFAEKLFTYVKTMFTDETVVNGIHHDDVCLGTSYFIYKDLDHLQYKIDYEILPALKEYYKDGIFRKRAVLTINDQEKSMREIFSGEGLGELRSQLINKTDIGESNGK